MSIENLLNGLRLTNRDTARLYKTLYTKLSLAYTKIDRTLLKVRSIFVCPHICGSHGLSYHLYLDSKAIRKAIRKTMAYCIAQDRYDRYINIMGEAESKAEAVRAINGFKSWISHHQHILAVAERSPEFQAKIAAHKKVWRIK